MGAEIEELDLVDLEDAIASTSHPDVQVVYENLARASRNHLRAFYRNLSMRGATYTPTQLSPEELAAIVESGR